MRSGGLRGPAAGAKLIHAPAECYRHGLFPLTDNYGVATRVAPIAGRDGNGFLMQSPQKSGSRTHGGGGTSGRHCCRRLARPPPHERDAACQARATSVRVFSHPHQHFAEVLPAENAGKSTRRVLQPIV